MRAVFVVTGLAAAVSGCATHLAPVRDFAGDTKKLSVAFVPMLDRAVERCRQEFVDKAVYASDAPVATFDAGILVAQAKASCQPIADKNDIARKISTALADYADQLAAVAGDGLASSLDDSYDELAGKLGEFQDLPAEKIGAVNSLLKFLTRAVLGRAQRQEVENALSHEEAVGALADALVTYTDRVYGAYVRESQAKGKIIIDALRGGAVDKVATRLQLYEVYRRDLQLQEQNKAVVAFRSAVAQMKATMKDVRANLDRLSDQQRLVEIRKLSKEVRSLYQQLAQAF
jgi:hypothetical protein